MIPPRPRSRAGLRARKSHLSPDISVTLRNRAQANCMLVLRSQAFRRRRASEPAALEDEACPLSSANNNKRGAHTIKKKKTARTTEAQQPYVDDVCTLDLPFHQNHLDAFR
jgi:hypothetical protein